MTLELSFPENVVPSLSEEGLDALTSNKRPVDMLKEIVEFIRHRFRVVVRSVYIMESNYSTPLLAATVGRRPNEVGRDHLETDESLTRCIADEMPPIFAQKAPSHPWCTGYRTSCAAASRSEFGTALFVRTTDRQVYLRKEPKAYDRVDSGGLDLPFPEEIEDAPPRPAFRREWQGYEPRSEMLHSRSRLLVERSRLRPRTRPAPVGSR